MSESARVLVLFCDSFAWVARPGWAAYLKHANKGAGICIHFSADYGIFSKVAAQ